MLKSIEMKLSYDEPSSLMKMGYPTWRVPLISGHSFHMHDRRLAGRCRRVSSALPEQDLDHRKQGCYSERTVYSWVTKDDLEMDLLDAVRDALRANDADHPWLSLSDSELLRAARLYGCDR